MSAGPLMLDLDGPELSNEERELLLRPEVGGVILFARNIVSRQQVAELCAAIRQLRAELLLAVDQEGGRVQRLRKGYTRLPPMQLVGDLFCRDKQVGEQLLTDTGWLMAAEVLASGLDFSFAPVLDLDRDHCQVIADRAFADEPELASRAVGHFIDGMHEAGMAATGKHFPGHGGVVADSHLETPSDTRNLEALRRRDLRPFTALASRLQGIMPAHIVFPNIDPRAVGFSRYWLQDILRGELGFEGVIFSDDLSMKGADVAGDYRHKAEQALAAGCDMVLVCNNRAGALTVADYLATSPPRQNHLHRLSAMKAGQEWSWSALETSDRRASVVEQLARIGKPD